MTSNPHSETPDGRYIVVRGRLWRKADPALPDAENRRLVAELMAARRAVGAARRRGDSEAERDAHAAVDRLKHDLGERGPVWWTDGAPDLNRHTARTTPYAAWFAAVEASRHCGGAEVTAATPDTSDPPHAGQDRPCP